MHIALWILQIVLALHTVMGAVWKFSNPPEQTMPSLKAIPNTVWLGMSGFELLIAVCLVLPAFYKPVTILIPIAAVCIVIEMLFFCALHLSSGDTTYGPLIYWLGVAIISAFLAYGRIALAPL
ncbi:MAG: DoxX family protein [Blastopirellula sp. JB062]